MNTEIKNDTNDTVEQSQNQNGAAEVPTNDQPAPAPTSSDSATAVADAFATSAPGPQPVEAATQNSDLPDGQPVTNEQTEPETNAAEPKDSALGAKCSRSACSIVPPRGPCRTRRGKIASLPPELRQWINEQLVLQAPTSYIINWLSEQGHPGITYNNISNWRVGGFQDYLKEAETTAERDKRWNSLVALARAQGSSVSLTSVQMALSHHHQLLASLDLTGTAQLLAEKPEYFFRLNTSLSHLIQVNEVLRKNSQLLPVKPSETSAIGREERGTTGGLTLEARDQVRKKLGIHLPPPPVESSDTHALEPREQPAVTAPNLITEEAPK